MFTILAAVALAAQSVPQETPDQKCAAFGEIAESVMKSRQAEVQMSKVMASTDRLPEWLRPAVRDMIRNAYARPSYAGPQAKAEEVLRFRNEWEAACYESMTAS